MMDNLTYNLTTIYTVDIEKCSEHEFIGTCLELQGVFINGVDEEDVMRRIRIAINEMLIVLGRSNKYFDLTMLVKFP